jgi:uncharacterized protein YjiS (DUF1127 family)
MLGTDRVAAGMDRPLLSTDHLRRWTRTTISTVAVWAQRSRNRHALARLDDHQLQDVAISPADAHRESAKPFWVP